MSVDLYERYKDALRRGHMSAAKGHLDAALDAYREAVGLAPDRALPHASIGQILLRLGAPTDALDAFEAALARAPRDEGAIRGRGETLARLGRRTEAADAFDILSDLQERAGRLGDACEATRHALDLAEQKARRRRLQELTRRLRLATGGTASGDAVPETAPRNRSTGGDDVDAQPGTIAPNPGGDAGAADGDRDHGTEAERFANAGAGATGLTAEPPAASPSWVGPIDAAEADEATRAPWEPAQDSATAEAMSAAGPTPHESAEEAAADAGISDASDVDVEDDGPDALASVEEPAPDPVALTLEAESLGDAGRVDEARRRYLDAAIAFEDAGLLAAAIDACYVALAFAPDDADVHLRLVELYLAAGWNAQAADKLALLGRLTELDKRRGPSRGRIVLLAAEHFPDDPRLRRLTAPR